jgi:thiol-disulfide isomerase/thioredoxin
MDGLEIALTLVALVIVATALGVTWKMLSGRVRRPRGAHRAVVDLNLLPGAISLGETATLVQFSTEMCSPCRQTHAVLATISAENPEIVHVDIDLTHRADVANRFNILQTPTTLIVDRTGIIRARIGGAVTRSTIMKELDTLLGVDPSRTRNRAAFSPNNPSSQPHVPTSSQKNGPA